jgi:general secretion pathway protein F
VRQHRLTFHRFLLRIPILGDLILQQETARFARTLGTLLKAGVPLFQASTSVRTVIGNCHIAAGLDAAIESIREGVALHRALQSETVFPSIALRMISVGEEAGKLDRMLVRVALTFEQQTQRSVDRLMTLLTPALTIMIALLVGGLIMTVMDALLSLNDLTAQ